MTWVATHQPCPCGQSSDAYSVNREGWGTCFSCNKKFPPRDRGEPAPTTEPRTYKPMQPLLSVEYREISNRGISESTAKKFGYGYSEFRDERCHVAPYADESGRIVAQKVRLSGKKFQWTGDASKALLFGQQLWEGGGKRIVVTEGEIDALSYAEVTRCSWPVVSVPNGAASAKKAVARSLEWLESFAEVVFLFDMDEPGQAAARECVELLSPGKAKIATLPLKDANEMLKAGKVKELTVAVWEAKTFRPDGIITAADVREEALLEPDYGLSWPWATLTRLTYGIRPKSIYALGAGTGVGKTDFLTQTIEHLITEHEKRVGVIFLEQPPSETVQRVAGKMTGRRFHVPDAGWSKEERVAAIDELIKLDRLYMYNHFGASDWTTIRSKIRYFVNGLGIKHIFLDHLTALAAGEEDERKALETIMSELGGMVQELDFTLFLVSHLATPDGDPHEEGGRVMIRHFKGSRAIGFWCNFMFGLERDQQAEDPAERTTTTFRCLKDRFTGQSTGKTILMGYDEATGTLYEKELEDAPTTGQDQGSPDDSPDL